MTDQQIAKRVGDILTGKAMKYTHTVHMKSGRKQVLQSDERLDWHYEEKLRECVLTQQFHTGHGICIRASDVEFFMTEDNEPNK